MGVLDDLLGKVKAVGEGLTGGGLVREAIRRYEADIIELQRLQLLEGKASSGEDLRPYYTEDLQPGGYFATVEDARRYLAWKRDDVQYPYSVQRNEDAPNLYINGRFHSELTVEMGPDAVGVVPRTPYAARIVKKYGLGQFGLAWTKWNVVLMERGGYEAIMDQVKELLR